MRRQSSDGSSGPGRPRAALPAAACSSSGSTDSALQGQGAGVLRVGTEGAYSPFSYHDPANNQLTGYDVEVINAVAAKMGVKAEFVETPFDAIFASLRVQALRHRGQPGHQERRARGQVRPVRPLHGVRRRHRDPHRRQLDHQAGRPQGQDDRAERDQQLGEVAKDAGAKVEGVEGFTQAVTLVKQSGSTRPSTTTSPSPSTSRPPATRGKDRGQDRRHQRAGVRACARRTPACGTPVNNALAELASRRHPEPDLAEVLRPGRQPGPGPPEQQGRSVDPDDLGADQGLGRADGDGRVNRPSRSPSISFVVGLAIALVVALMRLSAVAVVSARRPLLHLGDPRHPAAGPAVPDLLRAAGDRAAIDPFPAAVIAFSLNVGGYAAEIIRAAIPGAPWAVGGGLDDRDGLHDHAAPDHPAAGRAYGHPAAVQHPDLAGQGHLAGLGHPGHRAVARAQVAAAPTFEFFALYGVAAAYYWVICLVLSFAQGRLEDRLERYVAR